LCGVALIYRGLHSYYSIPNRINASKNRQAAFIDGYHTAGRGLPLCAACIPVSRRHGASKMPRPAGG